MRGGGKELLAGVATPAMRDQLPPRWERLPPDTEQPPPDPQQPPPSPQQPPPTGQQLPPNRNRNRNRQPPAARAPLPAVVRRLDHHLDVVRVRFLEARRGDTHEATLHTQFVDRARTRVEHRLAQPAEQLIDDG